MAIAIAAIVTLAASPAAAVVRPGPLPGGGRSGSNTQMTLSNTGPGQGVTGLIADPTNPFDPINGYPTSDPSSGFTPQDESFAGVIIGSPSDGSAPITLYCIDIRTDTFIGVGYGLGSWNAAAVPNVGYVARILNSYYPTVPGQPAGLANTSQQAAAVQAAIWFFSDRYVLRTADPLHNAVAAIVAAVIAAGPLTQPPPPSLTITPSVSSGAPGSVVGPFTVSSTAATTVHAVGGQMFANAAGTVPIADGTTVPSGQRIWLRSTGSQIAVLEATARATVPTGNVYLYDGNSGLTSAQKLILSQTAELESTVSAAAEFLPTGSLLVRKSIGGPAAGDQGPVTIAVTCDGIVLPAFTIAAGAPPGNQTKTYDNIPDGSVCTVDEIHDGHTSAVTATVKGDGQQITIRSGTTVDADLVDTYSFNPGALVVTKSIAGPAAGLQGTVVIQPTCAGTALPPFIIPAGAPAGIQSRTYGDIEAGSVCTITEVANGQNSAVTVTVTGGGQVTVPPGGIVEAQVTDTYDFAPGSLLVNKTIAGPAAGQQGPITITVTCVADGVTTTLSPPFTLPAGATAGLHSQTYTGIAGNSICTVIENPDGNTSTVAVVKAGSGTRVTVPPGGTATADLTDTYQSGALVVNKTITGSAAGHQGPVTIHTVCNGTALIPDLVIAASTTAGTVSQTYPGVLAGATCTVTETADGATSTVTVATTGSPQDVTISANGTATANLTDTYGFVPGSLAVIKTIAGSSAGQQGPVTIQVNCGSDVSTPDFVIPAGTVAGPVSHTYTGIPAGATCVVTETADGSSSTVAVITSGSPQNVTIAPDATATADITDTYTAAPGALLVSKTLDGPSVGQQGEVIISVTCGQTTLPDFVIAAGTAAGTVSHSFDGIPAGSTCVVTETADGTTATVETTVDGSNQQVTVPAGTVVPVGISDTYTDTPGSLTVTKTLAGPAAGQQGLVGILALCGGPAHAFAFVIPAGAGAGPVSRTFGGIPAGATCLVAEVRDGHTDAISVSASGSRQQVTVPAAGTATAAMTNTFTPVATEISAPVVTSPELAVTGPRAQLGLMIELAAGCILAGISILAAGRRRRGRGQA